MHKILTLIYILLEFRNHPATSMTVRIGTDLRNDYALRCSAQTLRCYEVTAFEHRRCWSLKVHSAHQTHHRRLHAEQTHSHTHTHSKLGCDPFRNNGIVVNVLVRVVYVFDPTYIITCGVPVITIRGRRHRRRVLTALLLSSSASSSLSHTHKHLDVQQSCGGDDDDNDRPSTPHPGPLVYSTIEFPYNRAYNF